MAELVAQKGNTDMKHEQGPTQEAAERVTTAAEEPRQQPPNGNVKPADDDEEEMQMLKRVSDTWLAHLLFADHFLSIKRRQVG